MAVSDLLVLPRDAATWNQWSFDHRDSHKRILQAIAAAGVSLTEYVLEPITSGDVTGFLQRNQQMHLDMNGLTAQQSNDLQDVDFKNENQLTAWIEIHWLEHQNVERALGL